MNIRFYNAKILTLNEQERFDIINGELWVKGDTICYVGESKNPGRNLYRTSDGAAGMGNARLM